MLDVTRGWGVDRGPRAETQSHCSLSAAWRLSARFGAMPLLLLCPSPFPPPPKILPGLWFVGVGWECFGGGGTIVRAVASPSVRLLAREWDEWRECSLLFAPVRVDSRAVGFSRTTSRQSGLRGSEKSLDSLSRLVGLWKFVACWFLGEGGQSRGACEGVSRRGFFSAAWRHCARFIAMPSATSPLPLSPSPQKRWGGFGGLAITW